MSDFPILAYIVIAAGFFGIAIGRFPRLAMNRSTIALTSAVLVVLSGGLGYREAFNSIDTETLSLLLAMMILVANLRLSGFFMLAGMKILSIAKTPKTFLALVVLSSGFLSALFINDTVCILLAPLVIEIARRKGLEGKPYLIALAVSANAGSCATIIGNPQNMLVAAQSGISFFLFFIRLFPPALAAMALCYVCTILIFRQAFIDPILNVTMSRLNSPPQRASGIAAEAVDKRLMIKSLTAAALLLVLLATGLRTSVAALIIASFLLVTRRTNPDKVFSNIDFSLLVFFSGLFVLTAAVAKSPIFHLFIQTIVPHVKSPGFAFAIAITLVSNLVSNVPAVMLLAPVAQKFQNSQIAWLMLAMGSTFAGNLTLLGSVANLIVAEQGDKSGIHIGFIDYLKVGLPVTLVSLFLGTLWLMIFL
jgi:Na+/H+ antiporter NhaD/arsenite permease-like protein